MSRRFSSLHGGTLESVAVLLLSLAAVAGCDPCRQSCAFEGLCEEVDGSCVATSEEQCSASRWCKRYGRCTLDNKNHTCTVGSDADCRAAIECIDDGRCKFRRDPWSESCVAASKTDCEKSNNCLAKSRCRLEGNACVQ